MSHVYVIAEAGVNHNGDMKLAKELIHAANESGADAVKFQTFKTASLVTRDAKRAAYQDANTKNSDNQFEMLKKLELSHDSFFELKNLSEKLKIDFLSTPFDMESLEFLVNGLKINSLKMASGEIISGPLLFKSAQSQKKIILSTGMSTMQEVDAALTVLSYGYLNPLAKTMDSKKAKEIYNSIEAKNILREKVSLLHCTTEYPAPYNETNLNAIHTLKNQFQLKTGFSDHTKGIHIPIAAVAIGATIIEKHFTLDSKLPGPDHRASLTPQELKEMVTQIRDVSSSLGNGFKEPTPSEVKNMKVVRKSITVSLPLKKGDTFNELNLSFKRPGTGISPMLYWDYLGKKAEKDYDVDEQI